LPLVILAATEKTVAASMPTTETVIEELQGEHNIGLARLLKT